MPGKVISVLETTMHSLGVLFILESLEKLEKVRKHNSMVVEYRA